MATLKKIKSILISQPPPTDENSPYLDLAKKFGLRVDFRKFIQIDGLSAGEFRKQGIHPLDYTAVIFTSKYAIDHFFRILGELKVEMPPETKYFCVSDATAKYLQKYIVIRKRKLFVGERTSRDLIEVIKKHSSEKFLFPCSNIHTPHLTDWMHENKFALKEAIIYNTVYADLGDVKELKYEMLCFFSPSGIESLYHNFPNFEQGDIAIGVFGPTTAQAAREAGLRVDVEAPMPNMPSMTAAIEAYLKKANGK